MEKQQRNLWDIPLTLASYQSMAIQSGYLRVTDFIYNNKINSWQPTQGQRPGTDCRKMQLTKPLIIIAAYILEVYNKNAWWSTDLSENVLSEVNKPSWSPVSGQPCFWKPNIWKKFVTWQQRPCHIAADTCAAREEDLKSRNMISRTKTFAKLKLRKIILTKNDRYRTTMPSIECFCELNQKQLFLSC